ncbi:MAG: 50S ribosomal protein L4 [Candidatus Kapaibacterium sp.]
MQVDVYNKDGQQAGTIELNDGIFAIEPNENIMHQAVVAYLANKRQGTHKTKTRSEVSGGGKKPWRQKGRGTARAGSIRSPLWVGGGTIHGPKPHKYTKKMPVKMKRLARKSAFSLRANEKNLMVVEDFTLNEIKTKNMNEILKALKIEGEKTLILLPGQNANIYLSSRNIPNVTVNSADKISTYDILSHKKLLLFKGAIENLEKSFS